MIKLLRPVPRREYWLGGLLSGVGSIVGAGISASSNAAMQKSQQKWQTSEREASQEYNTSERLASQDYQTSEREAQNRYAETQYLQYSSPQAMARQYAEAGLNPALAVDGGSVGDVMSGSGSTGGAPTGTTGHGQTSPVPFMPYDSLAHGFSDIAGALKSLSEAKKTGVDTSLLEEQFNDIVKQKSLQTTAMELANTYAEKMNQKSTFELQKLIQDIETGKLNQQELRTRIDILGKELGMKSNELETWFLKFDAELAAVNAKIVNTNADTDLKNQQVKESQQNIRESISRMQLNDAQIHNLTMSTYLASLEANFQEDTYSSRLSQVFSETTSKQAKELTDICGTINQSIEQRLALRFQNQNWFTSIKNISDGSTDVTGGISQALFSAKANDRVDYTINRPIPLEYQNEYMTIVRDCVNDYIDKNKVGDDLAKNVRLIYGL